MHLVDSYMMPRDCIDDCSALLALHICYWFVSKRFNKITFTQERSDTSLYKKLHKQFITYIRISPG
jgi:hypothetical protein